MPVMGPGDNQIRADEAYEELVKLIKDKYHIHYDNLCQPDVFGEDMKAELQKLKDAVRGIFRLDSWDGW